MSLVTLIRQRGPCKKNIAKCSNFLNTFQSSNDENVDFIILNNKLSTVRQIIEELSQLKHSYFTLHDDTDHKDALDVLIDLQAETLELEGSYIEELGYFKHCFLSKGWNTLDKTLRSFWETENISEEQPIITDELPYCEKHFEKTHFRKPCGKYSISLPFKENIQENVNLGDSRSIPSKELDRLW
ncbi:DUF1758 domain-containing protein [Trichonephila inaurata madagascariensis]|uniref:DUF1758 domain-containing protein n=1 Tax=Trichonephila inaurata madagascariensis TaxID=2747483 RepID=A0A8X6WV04_9ARAC|nr:DUF1758 domain-containing protein [Trichonephila inaurata madagascariensis]